MYAGKEIYIPHTHTRTHALGFSCIVEQTISPMCTPLRKHHDNGANTAAYDVR